MNNIESLKISELYREHYRTLNEMESLVSNLPKTARVFYEPIVTEFKKYFKGETIFHSFEPMMTKKGKKGYLVLTDDELLIAYFKGGFSKKVEIDRIKFSDFLGVDYDVAPFTFGLSKPGILYLRYRKRGVPSKTKFVDMDGENVFHMKVMIEGIVSGEII